MLSDFFWVQTQANLLLQFSLTLKLHLVVLRQVVRSILQRHRLMSASYVLVAVAALVEERQSMNSVLDAALDIVQHGLHLVLFVEGVDPELADIFSDQLCDRDDGVLDEEHGDVRLAVELLVEPSQQDCEHANDGEEIQGLVDGIAAFRAPRDLVASLVVLRVAVFAALTPCAPAQHTVVAAVEAGQFLFQDVRDEILGEVEEDEQPDAGRQVHALHLGRSTLGVKRLVAPGEPVEEVLWLGVEADDDECEDNLGERDATGDLPLVEGSQRVFLELRVQHVLYDNHVGHDAYHLI